MDQITHDVLFKMQLKNIRLIRLEDLEDDELRRVKPTRNLGEYCWTLSSSLPLFIFKTQPNVDQVAYLDSDLYFYSPIQPIYDELGNSQSAELQ
jgi:hypothetical protein